ncbi:hypothetical protein GPX89_37940 [Nocardia sp. ET3-3]|uniref:GNAT family N-acetyltransferase n=1 Tax=Nocardia terrae TaxID=2675851 RepID=A0A7K1V8Y4_9NOCA|nr:hypothetical protein [Nocardia terrae]MVU83007.1 hypothetical protein [Nocardia terrae]
MTVDPIAHVPPTGSGGEMLRLQDALSGYTFFFGPPHADPVLWRSYMEGALRVYGHYGAESAVDYDKVIDGSSTALFAVAVDSDGQAVAGVRAEGPFKHVDEVPSVVSWAGLPGEAAFRKMVADQIPDGVYECRTGWVVPKSPQHRMLADWVARAIIHFIPMLGARYSVGAAAEHALPLYRRGGARAAWWIPASSYPDERYRTVPLWWDLRTVRSLATAEQARAIDAEWATLSAVGPMPPTSWFPDQGRAQA